MRASQAVSIRPILAQAINAIDESFEQERHSLEFEKEFDERKKLGNAAPATQLERPSQEEYLRDVLGVPPQKNNKAMAARYRQLAKAVIKHPPITRPEIGNAYPWRHYAVQAVNSLAECGWTTEAGAITKELNELPTDTLDWNDPEVLDKQRAAIRECANCIRIILQSCIDLLDAKHDKDCELAAAQDTKPADIHRIVDQWFEDAQAVVNLCAQMTNEAKRLPHYTVRTPDQADFDGAQLSKLFNDLRDGRRVMARLLQENSEHLMVVLGSLNTRLQEKQLNRLFVAAYATIREKFKHGSCAGGMFAWNVLEPLGYAMRRWMSELSAYWNDCPDELRIEWQQQFAAKVAECPFEVGAGKAITDRLVLEHGQIIRDLATIHGKDYGTAAVQVEQVAAIAIPKKTNPKATLKAARIETLERFLEDARTYKNYEQAKQRQKNLTLRQYAAREKIGKPTQLQSRYHRYKAQGWTPKNVQAELDRKLAREDS